MKYKVIIFWFVSFGWLALFSLTTPKNESLLLYLLIFLILFIWSYLLINIVLSLAYPYANGQKLIYISTILAFIPTVILALVTVTTISVIDIVLAVSIPLIIVWYLYKR